MYSNFEYFLFIYLIVFAQLYASVKLVRYFWFQKVIRIDCENRFGAIKYLKLVELKKVFNKIKELKQLKTFYLEWKFMYDAYFCCGLNKFFWSQLKVVVLSDDSQISKLSYVCSIELATECSHDYIWMLFDFFDHTICYRLKTIMENNISTL